MMKKVSREELLHSRGFRDENHLSEFLKNCSIQSLKEDLINYFGNVEEELVNEEIIEESELIEDETLDIEESEVEIEVEETEEEVEEETIEEVVEDKKTKKNKKIKIWRYNNEII